MGAVITGVSWRMASWQGYASWPSFSVVFSNFDVYLGKSARVPGSLVQSDVSMNWGPDFTFIAAAPKYPAVW